MLRFISIRLAQSIFVMFIVSLIAFSLFRFVGDPVAQMVGQETSIEDQERLRERLGLNDPIPIQFIRFIHNTTTGNFGYSYRTRQPIGKMFLNRLPATIELSLVSFLISLAVGIPAGIYTALNRGRFSSSALLILTLVGVSVPTFVIGIFLIYIFGVQLSLLPTFGRGDTVFLGPWQTNILTLSGLKALILPSLTLAVYQLALTVRLVRSEMLEVLRTDYIKFAIARGISYRSVYYHHALKNSMMPVITIVGLQLGGIIAFSIVTESVFQWPGMGLLFLESIQFVDIPVMSTYLLIIAFLFVIINLIVDLLYFAIDPRISSATEKIH